MCRFDSFQEIGEEEEEEVIDNKKNVRDVQVVNKLTSVILILL